MPPSFEYFPFNLIFLIFIPFKGSINSPFSIPNLHVISIGLFEFNLLPIIKSKLIFPSPLNLFIFFSSSNDNLFIKSVSNIFFDRTRKSKRFAVIAPSNSKGKSSIFMSAFGKVIVLST